MDIVKADAIMTVYLQKKTRGRRQVQMQLVRQYDIYMSLGSVHRYMSIFGIQSIRKRKYMPQKKITQSSPRTFSNILEQNFKTNGICKKWLTDITYLPAKDGVLYLSCIKDLGDKSIIAYSMSNKCTQQLVMKTLEQAENKMRKGLLLHSDQGAHYCSPKYQSYLKKHEVTGSMSRKATPYDNAPMESFFSLLKNEELKLYRGLTMEQLRKHVERFINYYNNERPQWGLNKMTPAEYRNHFV